ncbi:palmitoyltransferase protein [Dioscorea alata]|uniref:Palmitoyltransferase protein n=1 Tax=Dioscorea alata TaxID=55571 RepID=A0ACB7VUB3_DIOAL|nr:palmitoyltransferase protein [Dioscorea alata]
MSGGGLLGFQRHRRSARDLVLSSLVSCSLVLLSQSALAAVPRILPSFSLLALLPVSALVLLGTLVLGRFCRRLLGVRASAPALVVFNLLFLWGVYIAFIRRVIPSLLDAFINAECALLLAGLYRILSGDPGIVGNDFTHSEGVHQNVFSEVGFEEQSFPVFSRVRYCNSCKASVRGFDHHCPAFGNCIGHKNHRLFMLLVIGFVIAEASYTMCSTKYVAMTLSTQESGFESNLSGNLVISTMLFSVLQVLWQVVFLMWHMYCICLNIKTDEWINWKKYPEFHIVIQPQGHLISEMRFTNPYNKGIIGNIKEFLKSKE